MQKTRKAWRLEQVPRVGRNQSLVLITLLPLCGLSLGLCKQRNWKSVLGVLSYDANKIWKLRRVCQNGRPKRMTETVINWSKKEDETSETRFGEISPLWRYCTYKPMVIILKVHLNFGKKVNLLCQLLLGKSSLL